MRGTLSRVQMYPEGSLWVEDGFDRPIGTESFGQRVVEALQALGWRALAVAEEGIANGYSHSVLITVGFRDERLQDITISEIFFDEGDEEREYLVVHKDIETFQELPTPREAVSILKREQGIEP